jgi:chromosome segregation ATPase
MSEADDDANAEPYACDVCDRYERELARLRGEVERLRVDAFAWRQRQAKTYDMLNAEATRAANAELGASGLRTEIARLRAEVERLTRLRAFDTSTVPLPPGLALEHERLDAMWRQLVAERDHARAIVAAADALREAAGAAVHELDPRPLQRAIDAYDAARGAP